MVHSRRKAEIEILTSGQDETNNIFGEVQRSSHGLLLRYLVSKTAKFMEVEAERK